MKETRWMALLLAGILCFPLTACGAEDPKTEAPREAQDVTLYGNFSCGSQEAQELDLIKTETVTLSEVTPEALAEELSAWTGLDFTLDKVTPEGKILTADWSQDSTLVGGLDDREQKEDFFFYDNVTLDWFMLDSLYQTWMENLDIEEVYYTMNGGQDLTVVKLYPVDTFPASVPYMGSPFYYAHSDIIGEEDPSMQGDPGDPPLYAATEGTWYLNGDPDSTQLHMGNDAGQVCQLQ